MQNKFFISHIGIQAEGITTDMSVIQMCSCAKSRIQGGV